MKTEDATKVSAGETRTARMIRRLGYRVRDIGIEKTAKPGKLMKGMRIHLFGSEERKTYSIDEMQN